MAGKRGRKNKYETHVKPRLTEIMEMCSTMTEQQIAENLGVAYSSFNDYKTKYPELLEVLKKGRQNLVSELRSALIKKAKGYKYTEMKETIERVRWDQDVYEKLIEAGLTGREIGEARVVKTEIAHKEYSPDVAALNLALKNYDKDNWANDPQMLDIRKKELELREQQIENNNW